MTAEAIQGDALEVLAEGLPGVPPNLILADPPFNCGKDYGGTVNDDRPAEEYIAWLRNLAAACYDAAAEDAVCYWFCPAFQLQSEPHLPTLLRGAGWQVREKEALVWYRPNGPGPRKRGTGQVWACMSEFIVYAVKGEGLPPKPGGLPESERQPWYHNVLTINTPQSNHPGGRWHVCQKPVRLYDYLIRAHEGVERVLDPTCGSGSALVACAELGIDAVGIEIVPESVQLTRERVAAAEAGIGYRAARQGTEPLFS